jgi:hypothetical protein
MTRRDPFEILVALVTIILITVTLEDPIKLQTPYIDEHDTELAL